MVTYTHSTHTPTPYRTRTQVYIYICSRDKNPFLSSFIKLATVSERQAPPIHARPRLVLAWQDLSWPGMMRLTMNYPFKTWASTIYSK